MGSLNGTDASWTTVNAAETSASHHTLSGPGSQRDDGRGTAVLSSRSRMGRESGTPVKDTRP
jgi:hypothetical protein